MVHPERTEASIGIGILSSVLFFREAHYYCI